MASWTIYDKNGNVKHKSVTEYNGDGEQVYADSLEYHGSWMGECFLSVSVKSEYPIDFQIGDYIEYRGERFILSNDPAVLKKASRGSYGEGFEYNDVKFSALHTELTDIRFLDYVLGDNNLHYTSLPDFPFYAADIDDYCDRLQANTNRWCEENGFELEDYWLFLTPSKERTVQRASCLREVDGEWEGLDSSVVEEMWNAAYANGINVTDEKKDISVTVNGQNIWESLTRIKEDFGLNFINRGRKVIVGASGIKTDHLFKYGKDEGLYEMERQVDGDQQVITKLYAYGTEKNMPVKYYTNIQKKYFGIVESIWRSKVVSGGQDPIVYCQLDVTYFDSLFTNYQLEDRPELEAVVKVYIVQVSANGYTVTAKVQRESTGTRCELVLDSQYESNATNLHGFIEAVRVSDKIIFEKYIEKKKWPTDHFDYSNIGQTAYSTCTSKTDMVYTQGRQAQFVFYLSDSFSKDYFILPSKASGLYPVDTPAFIVSVKVGNYKVNGLAYAADNGKIRVKVLAVNSDDYDYRETDIQAAKDFYDALQPQSTVIFVGGANLKTFPNIDTEYVEPNLPNNFSVNKLMLPGFPTMSLYDWVKANGGTDCDDETGQATWKGYTAIFSREKYRPYILSLNHTQLGIRESSKNFDGSDDTDEIYPTLEDSGFDYIQHAEIISDNGMIEDDAENKPKVTLLLPNFDDLEKLIGDGTQDGGTPTVSLKTGYCGGRDLEINKVKKSGNFWEVECYRVYDNSLELYFPYSYNVSVGERAVANEAYQVRGSDIAGYDGDKYVLTGIPMSTAYITAAASKLLEASLEYLSKNDYTRYTYLPKVDELFMARDQEESDAAGRTSLHDSIKEGDLLEFMDTDLLIARSQVFIDSLTIKENGNNGIPTYEVTLKDEKTVGTIQRIQNQINSLSSSSNVVGAQSGLSTSEVNTLIKEYTDPKFLSKVNEDTAEGRIGFLSGIWDGLEGAWEISKDGFASFTKMTINGLAKIGSVITDSIKSSDFTGYGVGDTGFELSNSVGGHSKLTIDEIYVRMKATFEELEVKKRTYTGGDQIWSCAGNSIVRVDYLGDNEISDHEPVMMQCRADGSPVSGGTITEPVVSVPEPGDTYGYSIITVPWLVRNIPLLANSKALSHYRKVRTVMTEPVQSRSTNRAASTPPINSIRRARLYFLANDGDGNAVHNWWRINDLVRCQTMNVSTSNRQTFIDGEDAKEGNIFWWRKCVGVSYDPVEIDGKYYHYLDVAFDYELEKTSPETMATSVFEGSNIPAAGDAIVQFGNTIIEGRMNLMVIEVNGSTSEGYDNTTDAPCIKAYRGVYCFDLGKCWVGGKCCKMKLSPKTGYEFYGPNFRQVTEYDVVPVPVDRGLWTNICRKKNSSGQYIDQWQFEKDDYGRSVTYSDDDVTGRTTGVRKCYYYDKVSHKGSYWLCSIVDGVHWVDGNGDYISDADYAALSDEQKALCSRHPNYTISEPSADSIDWTEVVEKGEQGNEGDTPVQAFQWNNSATQAPSPLPSGGTLGNWSATAPNRPSTAGEHFLWMTQSTKHYDDTYETWSPAVRISGDTGDAGEDASDREYVYKRLNVYPFPNTETKPADATRGKVHGTGDWVPAASQYTTDDWVPEGWSDTALPATEDEKYVYMAMRIKNAGHSEQWGDFTDPILWSNWGVQGIDGDGVQYVYKLFDHELTDAERTSNIPTKPASQTSGEWIPTGWSDDPLAPTQSMPFCYCSIIKKIGGEWSDTFEKLGLWSKWSEDGGTPEMRYQWNQSATNHPALDASDPSATTPDSNWSNNVPNRPGNGYYLWSVTAIKNADGTYGTWGNFIRLTGDTGTPGEDGSDMEWIYKFDATGYNGNTGEVSPTGAASGNDTNKNQNDWVPNGWYDTAQAVTKSNPTLYASFRRKDAGLNESWGDFQTPIVWSHYGRNGIDGDGIEYVFIRTNNNTAPTIVVKGDSYEDSNHHKYTDDEFLPVALVDGVEVECTDDPQGTDSTHHYEWVVTRKKPLNNDGETRTWEKYSGTMAQWSNFADNGAPGGNTATVMLYKRSSSAVSTVGISIPLYYKFSTQKLYTDSACTTEFTSSTTGGNGWSPIIPDGTNEIYVVVAVAYSNTDSDVIGTTEWVGPEKYTANGEHGLNSAVVWLYQRSSTPLTNSDKPTGTFNYTFSTGVLAANTGGDFNDWQQSIPSGDDPCYVIQAAALSQSDVDADVHEWSDVVKLVEDGDGIESITRTYGISAQSTTANETTAPSDISTWAASSPAVTESKPYLWAKEVVTFKFASSTTKYYMIGARGDNGVDSKDVEWAYIRTKTNIAPVISSDSTYTDSNGNTYIADDHLPKVVAGTGGSLNDIEDDNSGVSTKKYECTDDPKGVDDTWRYEWEIKRTKGAADGNGHRTWNYYDGTLTLHNNLSESALVIDIDNDNDQFGVDADGKVLVQQTRTANVTMAFGTQDQAFTSAPTASLKYDDGTTVSSTVAEVSVESYASGKTDYDITVTIKATGNNTPVFTKTGKNGLYVDISGTCNKGSKTIRFTLEKVMSGQAGVSPTIYQIAASQKAFAFGRNSSNDLTPSSRSSQINVAETEGNTTTIINTATAGLTYKWGWDEETTAQASNQAIGTSISVSNTNAASHNQVWVELSTGDRETLPITKDGAKGPEGDDVIGATVSPVVALFDTDEDGTLTSEGSSQHTIKFVIGSEEQSATLTDITCSIDDYELDGNYHNDESSPRQFCKVSTNLTNGTFTLYVKNGHTLTPDVLKVEVEKTIDGSSVTRTLYVPYRSLKQGETGPDGDDGWMIAANPANVILTQNLVTTSNFSSATVEFTAKKGGVNATVSSITNLSSTEFNVAKKGNTGADAKKVLVSSPKTYTPSGSTSSEYYTEGSFAVTVNVTDPDSNATVSFNLIVPCYANLLGKWTQTIEDGVETSVGEHLGYAIDPSGSVDTIAECGTFIRGWAENTSILEKTVKTKNLIPSQGWTDDAGNLLGTEYFTPSTQKLDAGTDDILYTPIIFLAAGTYVFSCYTSDADAEIYLYTSSENKQNAQGMTYGETISFDGVVSGDTYTPSGGSALPRRYAVLDVQSDCYACLNILDSENNLVLYRPQIEQSSYPTSWEIGIITKTSDVKQTADEYDISIRDGLNDTGINIANNTIKLKADKVKFTNSAGTVDNKVWIDSTSGTLHAVDGEFEGTVKASNFYHNVFIYAEGLSGSDAESGDADIVIMVPDASDWWGNDYTTKTVYLPDPSTCEGKLVEVSILQLDYNAGDVHVGCVVYPRFIAALQLKADGLKLRKVSNASEYLAFNSGQTIRLVSKFVYESSGNTGQYYWVNISQFENV